MYSYLRSSNDSPLGQMSYTVDDHVPVGNEHGLPKTITFIRVKDNCRWSLPIELSLHTWAGTVSDLIESMDELG